MNLAWIESAGGPLVLASKTVAEEWRGVEGSAVTDEMNDYQRACAVQDEIAVIPLSTAQVVVLGDEPDRTSLFKKGDDLYIVRWRWADSEESLLGSLYANVDDVEFSQSGSFSTAPGEHVLFDSAYAWSDIPESLSVDIVRSPVSLETALFQPSHDVCALIHRLRASEGRGQV